MHRRALCCLFLAACGAPTGGEPGPDAGGAADADTRGRIDVSAVDFLDPTKPGAGLPVVFTDANGDALAHAVTDSSGYANANVAAGATAMIAWPGEAHVEIIAGVAPGDHLYVGAPHRVQGWKVATMTVAVPPPPDGTHVVVLGPCPGAAVDAAPAAGGAWTASVELRPGCAPYGVVADAWIDAEHDVAYLAATNVTAQDGGTISLTGESWKTMPELHVRASGADVFQVERVSGPARFSIVRDPTKPIFDGVIAAPDVLPRADAVVSAWVDSHPIEIALPLPAGATDQTIEVSPYLVPSITSTSIDATRTRVSWTTGGAGAADATSIALYDNGISWYVLAPPDATSIALPPVPAGLALRANDQIGVIVTLDETDALADYAAARNLPSGGLDALLNADTYQHWSRGTIAP